MTLPATGPNAEQITFWNETAAPKWLEFQRALDEQLKPLGEMVLEHVGLAAGERVLDVGCGCGDTTLAIARRVGPGGFVAGIDISTPMLERARERAQAEGQSQVELWNADAQSHPLPSSAFDVVFSRFGVMFFGDPTRAFTNLRATLRPGGRLGFVCWQGIERNPWMGVPMGAAATVVEFPPRPTPDTPGPFAFADPERVKKILGVAGFTDVAIEGREPLMAIVGSATLDQAVDFLVQMGPTGAVLREADAATRARVTAAVKQAVAPFHRPEGLRMQGAIWIVSARSA